MISSVWLQKSIEKVVCWGDDGQSVCVLSKRIGEEL